MRVYISGRISGLDYKDVEHRFGEAERKLRDVGYKPISPLDNGLSPSDPWIRHMAKDIEILYSCDAIYMLEGWQESRGACIEYDFAIRTNKAILFASEQDRNESVIKRVSSAVHEVTGLSLCEYAKRSNERRLFYARMLFAYHCRKAGLPTKVIANRLRRNVATIDYTIGKYKDDVEYNSDFRALAGRAQELLSVASNEQDA